MQNDELDLTVDIAELRRILNNEFLEETELRKMRIAEIIRQVKVRLANGIPVKITEQMRQYGIVDQINELCMRAEVAKRLDALSRDDDDEDDSLDAINFGIR